MCALLVDFASWDLVAIPFHSFLILQKEKLYEQVLGTLQLLEAQSSVPRLVFATVEGGHHSSDLGVGWVIGLVGGGNTLKHNLFTPKPLEQAE